MQQIFWILFVFFPHFLWASSWSETNQKLLDKIISDSPASHENFGIWIQHKGEIVSVNPSQLFVPASLSKIPTALTFLDQFTMDQRFLTWIYKTGTIKDGVLKGDLYLKGGGDPTLVTESLWLMLNELKRSDIKKIQGQVYVDESYFDTNYYSDGRQTKRVDRAYDAPVSGLSFNWNSLSIYVRPGAKSGEAARVYVDPELPSIQIVNKAKTVAGNKNKLQVERKLNGNKMVVTVTGQIGVSSKEKDFYKSVGDAALWTGESFVHFMKQAGIHYDGDIKKRKVPDQAIQLVEFKGWEIPRVVAALAKFSNNFVAEMITKHLGKNKGEPGHIDKGLRKIASYLKSQGWSADEYQFENPSGFTNNNKMRADRLGELLVKAQDQFQLYPEFLSSLPISGVDGTLEKRLNHTMKNKVRAKTGYLSGVVSLAGYIKPLKGQEPVTFVLIYNGPSKHDWLVRDLFDKIVWRLHQNS